MKCVISAFSKNDTGSQGRETRNTQASNRTEQTHVFHDIHYCADHDDHGQHWFLRIYQYDRQNGQQQLYDVSDDDGHDDAYFLHHSILRVSEQQEILSQKIGRTKNNVSCPTGQTPGRTERNSGGASEEPVPNSW